jgi:hypothetical protein
MRDLHRVLGRGMALRDAGTLLGQNEEQRKQQQGNPDYERSSQ